MHDRVLGGLVTRYRQPTAGAGWLLFVHGLGESSLGFLPLLGSRELQAYGILAPDLPGYGRSPTPDGDPPSLEQLADELRTWIPTALAEADTGGAGSAPARPNRIVIVGHSMGGVLGQLLCESLEARGPGSKRYVLGGFVNVEGNVSRGDCGYSGLAEPFSREQYLQRGHLEVCEKILTLAASDPAHRAYYASVRFCDPRAFHRHSVELVGLSTEEGLAARFARLSVPKAFFVGAPDGLVPRSIELLEEHQIAPVRLAPAGHWPFVDQHSAFLARLVDFLHDTAQAK